MTVYEMGILMHYYAQVGDPEAIHAPIGPDTCKRLMCADLLIQREGGPPYYRITQRGNAYVEALQRVPLPTQRWVVEWPREESDR